MKFDAVLPFEGAGWPVLWLNLNGVLRRINAAAGRVFGLPPDHHQILISTLWPPQAGETVESFLGGLNRLCPSSMPLTLRTKRGVPVTFHVLFSEFKLEEGREFLLQCFKPGEFGAKAAAPHPPSQVSEAAVLQKQKLDCAMHLARSVAMDFNNALTPILGHTSLVLSQMDATHSWRNALIEIEKAAEKAAEVAQDLADFSRQEKDLRVVSQGNLNDVLRRTMSLFQSPGARTQIHWESEFEPRPYTVSFDEAKIQQALVRLLENSVQSFTGPGTIRVESKNVEFREPGMNGSSQVPPGYYLRILVTDTGPGISPEALPRVFEPFFSTKPNHRGLGLAWVYGIVTNHGGSVGVRSEGGAGTAVEILLPAQNKIVRDANLKLDDLFGVQTILVVDDEEMLLTMAEMILPAFGYRVLTASSGPKALEILQNNLGQIDLVLSDVVMPQMSGRELVEKIRKLAPEIRVVCMSGYLRPQTETGELYLQKPFTSQNLLRKVKEALS